MLRYFYKAERAVLSTCFNIKVRNRAETMVRERPLSLTLLFLLTPSRRIINLSPVMVIPEEQPAQPALPVQPEGMRVECGHCGNTFPVRTVEHIYYNPHLWFKQNWSLLKKCFMQNLHITCYRTLILSNMLIIHHLRLKRIVVQYEFGSL